jgi:hypothetical protein
MFSMTNAEPPERASVAPLVAELARTHDTACLFLALSMRLGMDERTDRARILETWFNEAGHIAGEVGFIAGALVARLRADGSTKLADDLSALLDRAGVAPAVNVPFLDRVHGAVLSARPTQPIERNQHGHTDDHAHARRVAVAHDARLLAEALFTRLHDDGHDVMAGYMMVGWLEGAVVPVVDPRKADDVMNAWLAEVAGPIINPESLAAALIHSLRLRVHDVHPSLADDVLTLLRSAGLPIRAPDLLPSGDERVIH